MYHRPRLHQDFHLQIKFQSMISSELTSSITGTEKLIILKEREKKENDQEIVGSITETVVIN